jgi:hypothetical protein
MGRPNTAAKPMVVSRLRPSSMAHMLVPEMRRNDAPRLRRELRRLPADVVVGDAAVAPVRGHHETLSTFFME